MPLIKGEPTSCGDCSGDEVSCRCVPYGVDADGFALPEWMSRCRACDAPISTCELCEECAKGKNPFPEVMTNLQLDLRR